MNLVETKPKNLQRRTQRRTQQERSSATQERLLTATIDCIVTLGYAGTSTTEICKRAGVSRGAQVHHYPTRAQLVAAAVERLFERQHQDIRDSLDGEHDLDEVISQLWTMYSGPTLHAWMELVVAARSDAALREQLRAVDESFFDQARLTCRRLLGLSSTDEATVSALARMILSVLDGLALNHTLYDDDDGQRGALELFKQVLAGLRQRVRKTNA